MLDSKLLSTLLKSALRILHDTFVLLLSKYVSQTYNKKQIDHDIFKKALTKYSI